MYQFLAEDIKNFVEKQVNETVIPNLMDYIRIPNLSTQFDPEWKQNGTLEKACDHLFQWANTMKPHINDMSIEKVSIEGAPSMIFIEIPKYKTENDSNVLFYGHYDKQPHFFGWREGLGPTTPVLEGDRLYGRGASDDGYSIFAAVTSIAALRVQGLPHPRCVMMFEGEEESGSVHLMQYFDKLSDRIGEVKMLSALDSGCGTYDTLWLTSSLRGNIKGDLKIQVLREGVHSGDGSGIVPGTFQILRQLLDRVENAETGRVHDKLQVNIPKDRYAECVESAQILGHTLRESFPFHGHTKPMTEDLIDMYLNRSWRPTVSYIGQEGLPIAQKAGNVVIPQLTIRLSMRLPPTLDAKEAAQFLKNTFEQNPPYNAKVEFDVISAAQGLNAPSFHPRLIQSLNEGSKTFFEQNEMRALHEGGSIPFLNQLLDRFPQTQFVVVGVLGPDSNAHGPNEMLHVTYMKKLISCLSKMVTESSDWL